MSVITTFIRGKWQNIFRSLGGMAVVRRSNGGRGTKSRSYEALLRYYVMVNRDRLEGSTREVIKRIAEDLHLSENWAKKVLERMKKMGLIVQVERGYVAPR